MMRVGRMVALAGGTRRHETDNFTKRLSEKNLADPHARRGRGDAVGIDSSPARIPGGHRQGSDLAPAAARLASE